MYSPDGFASLACLMQNQCFFLGYQAPFVELMKLFHENYIAFFVLQALVWFSLIGSIYFLSKTLKLKHLFLTPFLLIFASTLFIDNYVGGFENDYMAIVLFIVAMIFWFREKHYLDKWIAITLIGLGSSIWFWFGYFRIPEFWNDIAEINWWAQILAWGILTPIYLLGITIAIWAIWKDLINTLNLRRVEKLNVLQQKDSQHFAKLILISFLFPKLFFFAIPLMLKTIDAGLKQLDFKPNYKFWMTIIIFGLLLGQGLRVGILTYQAWSFDTSTTNCFTVNHEYLARVQGKSLNYNQVPLYIYNECLKREAITNGTT